MDGKPKRTVARLSAPKDPDRTAAIVALLVGPDPIKKIDRLHELVFGLETDSTALCASYQEIAQLVLKHARHHENEFVTLTLAHSALQLLLARIPRTPDPLQPRGRALLICLPQVTDIIGIALKAEALRTAGWETIVRYPRHMRDLEKLHGLGSVQATLLSGGRFQMLPDEMARLRSAITTLRQSYRRQLGTIIVGGRFATQHPGAAMDAGADFLCPTLSEVCETVTLAAGLTSAVANEPGQPNCHHTNRPLIQEVLNRVGRNCGKRAGNRPE